MILKNISDINIDDFKDLVSNGVMEGKAIEYKQDIPLSNDQDKREFLYDVSSFANAGGGNLIAGITEDRSTGLPNGTPGIEIGNTDESTRKIENLLRDGIAPRIVGIQIGVFKVTITHTILLIRIPKSWNAPHQVIFKGADKFYTRSTNGKYKLDVTELRNAFILSDTITERVRKFREDRIAKIIADETPLLLTPHAKIVIQFIPISSFEPNKVYDISNNSIQSNQIRPLGGGGWDDRFNMDGRFSYASAQYDIGYKAYLQLYRNGIIETVNSEILRPYEDNRGIPCMRQFDFEKDIIECFQDCITTIKLLKIDLPIYCYITLTGVKGYHMELGRQLLRLGERATIDRDILNLPEIIIEKQDLDIEYLLHPIFNMIWNACGYEKSFSYDDNNNRVGPK